MDRRGAGGRTLSASTPGTRACTGPSGSRWTRWTAVGIPYDDTPGVSSFCGAAAALGAEYTLPGREPERHHHPHGRPHPGARRGRLWRLPWPPTAATMVLFLSAGMLEELSAELLEGAYTPDTPAALVYKATWPEEKVVRCTVGTLARAGVEQPDYPDRPRCWSGAFLRDGPAERSRLVRPGLYSTGFREAEQMIAAADRLHPPRRAAGRPWPRKLAGRLAPRTAPSGGGTGAVGP